MNPVTKVKIPFQILAKGESIEVACITSAIEKASLEIQALKKDAFGDICDLYNIPSGLPESLKMVTLLKIREISNGSDCNVKFTKCPHCSRPSEGVIYLENLLDFSNFDQVERFRDISVKPEILRGATRLEEMIDAPISKTLEFIEDPVEVKSLLDLQELKKSLLFRFPKIRKTLPCKCPLCRNEIQVSLTKDFCLKALSEHDIASMYKTYHSLVINGFSKADIDSMLPFEREVQKGLIDKVIEEAKKSNKKD